MILVFWPSPPRDLPVTQLYSAYECNVCGKRFSISSNAGRPDRACHSEEAIQAAAKRQQALNKLLEEASCRTYSREDDPNPSSSASSSSSSSSSSTSSSADEGSESTRSLVSPCPSSPEYYQSKPRPLSKISTTMTSSGSGSGSAPSTHEGRSFSYIKSLERPSREDSTLSSSYYPPSRRALGISISALLVNDEEADREMKQEEEEEEEGDALDVGSSGSNSTQQWCKSVPPKYMS